VIDPLREIKLRRRVPYRGKILDLLVDEVKLARGGTGVREVVRHHPAVAIVPLLTSDSIIFIRHYRYAQQQVLWELPAGIMNPGETPHRAAARELAEETGFSARRLIKLGGYFFSPGFTTEIIHLFLAVDLKPAAGSVPDADEDITQHVLSFAAIEKLLQGKKIQDAKSVLALLLAFPKLARAVAPASAGR
jgi:ADP-ribose pyrophosphatase